MKIAGILVFLLVLSSLICASSIANDDSSNWPQWRGPFLNGMARGDAPTVWSDTKNVKWNTHIPGRGHSTPVIWRDKIFLTTAIAIGERRPAPPADDQTAGSPRRRGPGGGAGAGIEHRLDLLCLDRKSGRILWQRTARTVVPHEGYHRIYGSFASNSPITDGRYVYASFGSNGIYCFDMNGKLIWQKDLGIQMRMRLQFGEGAAPTLDKDRLIQTFDHEGESFIVALDKLTGKEIWRVPRDEMSSWSTPLIVEHAGRRQVIVSATNKVRSYDVQSGKLIWECAGLGTNVIPAPIYQNGVVFVMSGHRNPKLMAIRLGKEGDLTGSESVLWSHTRGVSYTPSPVYHEGKLYLVTDTGHVSCYNTATGEPYYQQVRLPRPQNFKASPVGANGRLYLATEEGDVIVIGMGEKFEVLASNNFEDQTFIASPVIVNGDLFLRSQNRLYCISEGSGK